VDAVTVISREGCHARAREIVQLPTPPPRSSDDEEGFLPGGFVVVIVIQGQQADLAKELESRQSRQPERMPRRAGVTPDDDGNNTTHRRSTNT
jgi:hypothetical protein